MTQADISPNPEAEIERYKLAATEEVTAGYVKELFGNVVGYSLAGSRRAIAYQYEQEAQHAYMTQSFEVSLDRFCHLLALLETVSISRERHANAP